MGGRPTDPSTLQHIATPYTHTAPLSSLPKPALTPHLSTLSLGTSSPGAGVLEVRQTWTLPQGVLTHGGWPSDVTLPRSRRNLQHSIKDPGGYTSGDGGFWLYTVHNPTKHDSTWGSGLGIVRMFIDILLFR